MDFSSPFLADRCRVNCTDYVAQRQRDGRGAPRIANRMTAILDMLYDTRTGRELIECAATFHTQITFFTSPWLAKRMKSGVYYDNEKNIVKMVPGMPVEMASPGSHELCHVRQRKNDIKKHGIYWDGRYISATVNALYADIISEGDAFTIQTINAYELHLKGIEHPWQVFQSSGLLKPLAQALVIQLNDGNDLYSDNVRHAIFQAWMTGPLRLMYEFDFMQKFNRLSFVKSQDAFKMSFTNDDFRSLVADNQGHSYLDGIDLMQEPNIGPWNSMRSRKDLNQAILSIPARAAQLATS